MEQIQELFLDFIQIRFPNAYTSFQLNNVSQILLLLKRHSISMPECKRIANSNGFLLPFLNGVLNTLTLQILPHHDSNYITHIIPVNFDITVNTLANTAMSKFLMEICNFSANRLNVLRAWLYCLFVNCLDFMYFCFLIISLLFILFWSYFIFFLTVGTVLHLYNKIFDKDIHLDSVLNNLEFDDIICVLRSFISLCGPLLGLFKYKLVAIAAIFFILITISVFITKLIKTVFPIIIKIYKGWVIYNNYINKILLIHQDLIEN